MTEQNDQGDIWEVFVQSKPGLPHKHVGNVHAYDKQMALENARDLYTRRKEAHSLWVVLASTIVAVPGDETESFFDPADDKVYRHPTFYEVPEGVTHI
ncbi:MAG: 1,2-phenylacetyl-CoA epoxidase subunit B [Flavobacteriales bacterium]|nr:1,2-phenylacetyl-CoA epoxidase subunit B [Flavobacteriales bacterium]